VVTLRIVPALFVGLVIGGAWQARPSARTDFNVIGYYADWTAGRYPLAEIPAAKLTHLNYAFAKIGSDNRLTWNAGAAVEQVYPGDCTDPGCPHGLFNQITLLNRPAHSIKDSECARGAMKVSRGDRTTRLGPLPSSKPALLSRY